MAGGGGRWRRWARGVVVVPALVLVSTIAGGHVAAHSIVEEITPADGTLLASAPAELRIRFSEPISDAFTEVTFIRTPTPIDADLHGLIDPNDPTVLVVALPPLDDGLYQIGFGIRDQEDLHQVRGRTSFSIGDHAMAAPSPPPSPPAQPIESTARWLFAVGLALLVGVVITRARWPDAPVAYPRRLAMVSVIAVACVVAGRVGVILARAHDLDIGLVDGLAVVGRTSDVARLPVVLVAALCAVPSMMPRRFVTLDAPVVARRSLSIRSALGWLAVTWLALVAAWGDHAALRGTVEPGVALAKAVHLLGIGVWVGVLAVTLIVNVGSGRTVASLHASSRTAVIGAMLTVASGLLLAGRMVVSITGLFATAFGHLLLLKLLGIVVAVAAGLVHRRVARTGPAVIEALILVLVVLLGASMATSGPATDVAYLPAPVAAAPAVVNGQSADVLVRLRAVPARPGPNDIEINIVQTRRPAPAPVTRLTVTATTTSGPKSWTVVPDDHGAAVITGVNLPEGTTAISVAMTRPSLATADVDLELSTQALRYHHPVIVSSQPIRTPVRMLALAVGLLAIAFLITLPRRRLLDSVAGRFDVHSS